MSTIARFLNSNSSNNSSSRQSVTKKQSPHGANLWVFRLR